MAIALAVIVVLAALLALVVPGVLIVSAACPRRARQWRWTTGATLGMAAGVYVSFLLSYEDIYLFAPVWALLGACCFWSWRRQRGKRDPLRESLAGRPSRLNWALLIVLAMVWITRVGTVAGREVPKGWDASFHMILTQKILLSHQIITDWQPFEAIALNYPLGSHTLLASLAGITMLPPHQVFNLLFPMLGVLMTAEVYTLAVAASRRHALALLAAIAYAFLALLGSIDYVRWGGLPNAMGMLFLLSFLRLLIEREFPGRRWMMAMLVAAIILVHHHVMLTACIAMAGLVAWALLKGDRKMAATILVTGISGSILAAPHVVPYLIKAGQVTSTAVLDYETPLPLWMWIREMGWAFSALAVVGAGWYGWRRFARRQHGPGSKIHWVISGMIVILLLLYVATGIIYPAVQTANGKPPLGAFTPSRFLTDVVPFAAVFAGYAMYSIVQARLLRVQLWHMAALGVIGTLTLLPAWRSMFTLDYPPGLVHAYQWISQNTPPQTFVASTDAWAPYLCWRKTLQTPVPVSEPQSFHEDERLLVEYLGMVLSGAIPPASPDLVVVRVRRPGDKPGSPLLLHEEAGYAVEQLWPRK